MNSSEIVSVLNRLLRALSRSLPMYLADARPWTRRDDQAIEGALVRVVADRRTYAQRVIQAVVTLGGRPEPGGFPLEFAGVNDLALEYLRARLIEGQRQDVESMRRCAEELQSAPALQSLAEEALGNARGHLDILEGMISDE